MLVSLAYEHGGGERSECWSVLPMDMGAGRGLGVGQSCLDACESFLKVCGF